MPGTHKYGSIPVMKTTLEIPDQLLRKAKAKAAEQGQTLRQFVTDAVREKLDTKKSAGEPKWMKFFGAGKPYAESIHEIDRVVEEEFERIEKEDVV